jgi:trehalose-6-phosphate synthase
VCACVWVFVCVQDVCALVGSDGQRCMAGVLVLSEFAGAAQSLGAGAILINPWNIKELADAIRDAVNMEPAV